MNLKELVASVGVDHASSWLHLINFYFYNLYPYQLYLPGHIYGKVLAAFCIVTVGHIVVNMGRYLKNKQKIADRQERARLNVQELKTYLDNTVELDDLELTITSSSFDELSSLIKKGSVNPSQVLLAFQRKSLSSSKDRVFIAEYILNKDVTMTTPIDPTSEELDPIFGIPVSLSEVVELHEKDRTIGFGGFVGIPAKCDAHIVKLLKASGAHPFLRTNITQALTFCPSLASSNPIFGQTTHPYSNLRSPGGGSCGEACALAGQASVLGVGADLIGGIRIPAHFCGIAALRTTSQRVSTYGLMQGQSLVPTCVGPMARDVSCLVAFMRSVCVSHQTDLDPSLPSVPFNEDMFSSTKPLRIGYFVEDGYTRTTPAVSRAIREAKKYLEQKGHQLVQFVPPDMKQMLTELLYPGIMGSNYVLWRLLSVDVVDSSMRPTYYRIQINNAFRWLFSWWKSTECPIDSALDASELPITMEDWWNLTYKTEEFRKDFSHKWKMENLDALLCPVMPCAAINIGNEQQLLATLTHVGLFSLLNYPAGTVPVTVVKAKDLMHFQSSSSYLAQTALDHLIAKDQAGDETVPESSVLGYPVGVQVAGLPYHEETVLRVMMELEQGYTTSQQLASQTSSKLLSFAYPKTEPMLKSKESGDVIKTSIGDSLKPEGKGESRSGESSSSTVSTGQNDADVYDTFPVIDISISKLKPASSRASSVVSDTNKKVRRDSKKKSQTGEESEKAVSELTKTSSVKIESEKNRSDLTKKSSYEMESEKKRSDLRKKSSDDMESQKIIPPLNKRSTKDEDEIIETNVKKKSSTGFESEENMLFPNKKSSTTIKSTEKGSNSKLRSSTSAETKQNDRMSSGKRESDGSRYNVGLNVTKDRVGEQSKEQETADARKKSRTNSVIFNEALLKGPEHSGTRKTLSDGVARQLASTETKNSASLRESTVVSLSNRKQASSLELNEKVIPKEMLSSNPNKFSGRDLKETLSSNMGTNAVKDLKQTLSNTTSISHDSRDKFISDPGISELRESNGENSAVNKAQDSKKGDVLNERETGVKETSDTDHSTSFYSATGKSKEM